MSKKMSNKVSKNKGSDYTPIFPTRITPPIVENPAIFKVVCTANNIPITMQYYRTLQPMTMYLVEERDSRNADVLKAEPHLIHMASFRRAMELFPEKKHLQEPNMAEAQRHFALAVNLMKDAMQRSYMAGRAPLNWDKMPNNVMFLLDQYCYYVHDLHQPICFAIRNIVGESIKMVYERGGNYTEIGVNKMLSENVYSMAQMNKERISIAHT